MYFITYDYAANSSPVKNSGRIVSYNVRVVDDVHQLKNSNLSQT